VTGFGEEDARGVWQAGNAAFMRNWPYAYSLGQAEDSVIKDSFDVSPLPAGAAGRAATLGGWQLAVSKYSENPEAAADLALFMASYEEQKARAIEGSFNPTIMSLYEDEDVLEATPFFGSLYDVFINAVARPSTATAPQYAETSRIFFNGVHSVLTGETDALTAVEIIEADLVDLLAYETGEPAGMPEIKEELEIYSWWAGDEGPALEALIDLYTQKYPDIEVINATVAGGSGVNAKAVLKTRMLGGDPPDTFQVHAGQELIGTWVVEGKMEDLTFLYEEEGWFDKYPEGLIELLSTEEGIWSVPVNIHRSNVLWYIPENLDEWGVEAPETWDDFLAICPTLQDQDVVPLSLGTNWTHNHLWEAVAVAELGVDGWNALWDGTKEWTEDDVVATWEKFGQILECTNDDAITLSWQQASDMVINGEAAFNEMGDWANGYFETTKGLEPNVDYSWSAAPGTDGVFLALSDSFGLPEGAPNRDAVIKWLRLLGSVEGQDTFNPLKGSIAAHIDSDLSLYSAYSQSAAEDWANDTVVPSLVHGAAANETFMNGFATAMELYLSSGDAEATTLALQELCVDSGICK
jgi:glucose/mannose transport system substrate-binding protein